PLESAHASIQHMHDLHVEIRKRINASNETYKMIADLYHRFKEFVMGDEVMIKICSERFPQRTIKKLQAHNAGPYKILKRLGLNACLIDFP
ncbi:hypothetical protein PJP07_30410, partial [Mycobacterium kansasii]